MKIKFRLGWILSSIISFVIIGSALSSKMLLVGLILIGISGIWVSLKKVF
ncbi:hypothetical protein [Tenacibaculum ovolyticum]|nr:hypothetical protein [Tenacibaculum ovolyticum]